METSPGVVFSAHYIRFAPVRDIVADMPKNCPFSRLAVSRSLQTVAGIPREAYVQPFPGLKSLGRAFLVRFGLDA